MQIYLRPKDHALNEPEDSVFYGDQDGMIVEGPQEGFMPTYESGHWHPGKWDAERGMIVMADEPEERDDWKEIAIKEHHQGVPHQYWILEEVVN